MKKAVFICLLSFAALFLSPDAARAGLEHNISGYAWSSTIGWISFNCVNDNSCATSNYGVHLDDDDKLVGYAWSSNIGWVKFGGLSGFPTGGGTQAQNANLNGNNLKGWARALSYDSSWSGWIALSGSGYGVALDGPKFGGFAWGSDVIGWLNFYPTETVGVELDDFIVPGFNIAGPDSLRIQFLAQSGGDSESGTYFVDNGGTNYNKPVTITVDPITPTLPAGATILYSLDGGANFSAGPSLVINDYGQGFGFKIRLNKSLDTSTTYTTHLKGTGNDGLTSYKDVILNPVIFNPIFEEL